jgi:uncharacterized protein YndB with AHSA1/START domain
MSQDLETRAVVVERTLSHPPEKVWRALTEGDLLACWIMPNDFRPAAGHRFAFRTEASAYWNGVVQCEVLEVEPPHRLVLRWGDGTPEGGQVATTVVFTLAAEAGGVRLRMEQSGFGPNQENNRRGAEFGWVKMMDGLEQVLEALA